MIIYTFHRDGGFYPLELSSEEEAIANAECNPGTIKVVNEITGETICPPGSACPICGGAMWVCERHADTPWRDGCPKCGGAGMNCRCNPNGEFPPGFLIIASRDDYSNN